MSGPDQGCVADEPTKFSRGDSCAQLRAARLLSEVESAQKLLAADAEHRSLGADQVLMLGMVMPYFRHSVRQLSQGIYRWFHHQGFWGPQGGDVESGTARRMKKTEKLALIVTEVSECIEAVRKDDSFNEAEELADILVRVLDYAGGFNIDLAEAFHRKMIANYDRPYKHGKQF